MPLAPSATEMTTAATSVKIGTVQRHNATVGGQAGDQLAAGGNVHGFHKRKCPYRECKNLRQGRDLCPTMCPGLTDSASTAGHQ